MVVIIGILCMPRILTARDGMDDGISFLFFFLSVIERILRRGNQVTFTFYINHFLTFL